MALVVITGGARSGKSAAAARLAERRADAGAEVVVAAFGEAGWDAEMDERIARHRDARDARFTTLEAADPTTWTAAVPEGSLLVLDCLGSLVARLMAGCEDDPALDPVALEATLDARVAEVVSWLCGRAGDAIVVTNEVGSGVVPAYPSGRVFRDVLGRANAVLISIADASCLAVSGRLVDLGALPRDVPWPGE